MSVENQEKELFNYLESTMDEVDLPKLPDEQLEYLVESAIDPIVGAKIIQLFAESQSPEAHDYIIRKYNNLLNFTFMPEYINSPVFVRIEDTYEAYDDARQQDMAWAMMELEDKGEVRIGGRLGYFEHHYYTDPQTNITRPILSLRLHGSAFAHEDGNGGKPVGIPNWATIPVTAISDYTIHSRNYEQ